MPARYSSKLRAPRRLAPGVFMQLPGVATFEDVELEGARYDVEMTLDLTPEGVRPTSVEVSAREGSPPVSGTTLRAVRVGDLAREAILKFVDFGVPDERGSGASIVVGGAGLSDAAADRLRRQGPVEETLRRVAFFYSLGNILGLPPARFVEINMRLPRTTASKWVRRAREDGLLDG